IVEGAITSRKQNRPFITGEEGENAGIKAGRRTETGNQNHRRSLSLSKQNPSL
ncbi:unnamed protein product, partial [Brassica rapa subsp. narinosa]